MLITGCFLHTPPPTGYAVFIEGDWTACCGYCMEAVYPHIEVLRNHYFNWDGSRMTWYARDFGMRVHACASHVDSLEKVEIRKLTAV